jgi:hypothetical protein
MVPGTDAVELTTVVTWPPEYQHSLGPVRPEL